MAQIINLFELNNCLLIPEWTTFCAALRENNIEYTVYIFYLKLSLWAQVTAILRQSLMS